MNGPPCDDCLRPLLEWEHRAYIQLPHSQYFSWVCLRCAKARGYDDLVVTPAPNRAALRKRLAHHVRYLEGYAAKAEHEEPIPVEVTPGSVADGPGAVVITSFVHKDGIQYPGGLNIPCLSKEWEGRPVRVTITEEPQEA